MTEAWRFVCARCGSVSVRKQQNGMWACINPKNNDHYSTPAVFDLKERKWLHVGKNDEEKRGVASKNSKFGEPNPYDPSGLSGQSAGHLGDVVVQSTTANQTHEGSDDVVVSDD